LGISDNVSRAAINAFAGREFETPDLDDPLIFAQQQKFTWLFISMNSALY